MRQRSASKTILVSNRLPVSISRGPAGLRVQRSPGGLASALTSSRDVGASVWIGWPGIASEDAGLDTLQHRLRELHLLPIALSEKEITGYYESFSNGVVWPLFHYLPSELPLRVEGWREYVEVNRRFAAAVAAEYQPGDLIWIHDYQLLLLPGLVRERIPDARIGFFLHIPFPGAEIFAILPHRDEILRGMLGADLIGFHTNRYRQHFTIAVRRLLGLETTTSEFEVDGRKVQVGVFPISVDAQSFQQRAAEPEVLEEVGRLRSDGCKLVVGVDRLDYTKGIPRRLLAFEQLLEREPQLRECVRLVQVAVPTRDTVGAYRRFRREVTTLVGEINGRFGTPHWTPVHYVHRSVPQTQLLALYRGADVMFVTPIRDGMNLVAKEFVATRSDEDGVLVLSEFAGAAAELTDAIIVNPFDVERTAAQLKQALELSREARRTRMRSLRSAVFAYDIARWTREFLHALGSKALLLLTLVSAVLAGCGGESKLDKQVPTVTSWVQPTRLPRLRPRYCTIASIVITPST